MTMKKVITKWGEKLPRRRARLAGYAGAQISIPGECAFFYYDRYIDYETGIITLVPVSEEDMYNEKRNTRGYNKTH